MHELTVTRLIAAPPEQVWQVMAYRTGEWWCPVPWRADVSAWDRRAGGSASTIMHGPNGEVSPHDGIFLAWDEGRRFVSTDAVTSDLQPAGPFMLGIWQIAPEGAGTRYTATARHWTEETARQHEEMGFTAGWGACADQLAALCEQG